MANSFAFEILTPARKVFDAEVSEVVIPAYDGEAGVLPDHGDFIGLLGTGALKIVTGGNDHWFMVSSGIYEVKQGSVTVFTDVAEQPEEVDVDSAKQRTAELEKLLAKVQDYSPEEYFKYREEYDRESARLEIHRRTDVVN